MNFDPGLDHPRLEMAKLPRPEQKTHPNQLAFMSPTLRMQTPCNHTVLYRSI